jgi:hypothetical protein
VTRIIMISVFGALLAASSTVQAEPTNLAQERAACSDVGIDQGSPAFAQCVANLDGSLSQLQQLDR